ncbi:hypothetical protein BLTE_10480 [Blastochloris tepida]|uniref:Uncharacterized protein n=1 Tax=Blastochloris tepida TaxID=2233851 RepID=A0A348FYI0_9HYPH|nr:hypothetical protein BLTE_10480 [Blastochloris tepida]
MLVPRTRAEHFAIAAELRRRAERAPGPISARALRAAADRHETAARRRSPAAPGA